MNILGFYISMSIIWLGLGLIFLIVEALTAGLTTIWFAAGALVALFTDLLNFPVGLQIVIFFAVSICLLIFTRKIFVEKLKTGSEKTNVDALIGQKAVVIKDITPFNVGQVKANGQVWSAISVSDQQTILSGKAVLIDSIEGVKLIVHEI